MKISKRQLKRIIKEALKDYAAGVRGDPGVAKSHIDPEDDELRKAAAGLTDDDIYFGAISDLEEELKNSIANALEKGLIIDDLEDAWSEAKLYIEEMG